MSDKSWWSEIKSLEQLRDELKVQAHLLSAELRDELAKAEKNLERLRAESGPLRDAVDASVKDVGAASKALFASVKESYDRIVEAVRKR